MPEDGRPHSTAGAGGFTNAEFLATFRLAMAADLLLARQAVANHDFAQVGALAHRITGACSVLGAGQFALACAGLAYAAECASAARAAAALARFERQLAALDEAQVPP